MKKSIILVALAIATLSFTACDNKVKPSLKTEIDSVSYAWGLNLGGNFKRTFEAMEKDSVFLNKTDFLAAIQASISGDSTQQKLTEEEAMAVLQAFDTKMQQQMQERAMATASQAKVKEDAFFAEKDKEAGIKKTASGLRYKVEKEGTGKQPTAESSVKVNYKGTLIDGTEFDSSISRGEPAIFNVNQVIPGWTEGLQLMKEGGKYTFYVPAALGYGERQISEVLKPNSTLIFEVELLGIESKK